LPHGQLKDVSTRKVKAVPTSKLDWNPTAYQYNQRSAEYCGLETCYASNIRF
jgi:hypothetical protein